LIFRPVIKGFCILSIAVFSYGPAQAQGIRYWDQTLNSEAALLSNIVVAGESGVAAIYYNPATITEMKRNNLSLSGEFIFRFL